MNSDAFFSPEQADNHRITPAYVRMTLIVGTAQEVARPVNYRNL